MSVSTLPMLPNDNYVQGDADTSGNVDARSLENVGVPEELSLGHDSEVSSAALSMRNVLTSISPAISTRMTMTSSMTVLHIVQLPKAAGK